MSAEPSVSHWPTAGSSWDSLNDLMLCTQLAGLRSGIAGPFKHILNRVPTSGRIRCGKTSNQACHYTLLHTSIGRADDPVQRFIVMSPRTHMFDAAAHDVSHSDRLSLPLEKLETTLVLGVNGKKLSAEGLNQADGALRAIARRDGRYLKAMNCGLKVIFSCASGPPCSYTVHFARDEASSTSWTCCKAFLDHSCPAGHVEIHKELKDNMSFFARVNLLASGPQKPRQIRKRRSTQKATTPAPNERSVSRSRSRSPSPPTKAEQKAAIEQQQAQETTPAAEEDQAAPRSISPELGAPPALAKMPTTTPTRKSRRRDLRIFLKKRAGDQQEAYKLLIRPYAGKSKSLVSILVKHKFVGEILLEWWKKDREEMVQKLEGMGVSLGMRVALEMVLSAGEGRKRKKKRKEKGASDQ